MSTQLDTLRPVSWLAWTFALLASVLLHVGLVRLNPNLLTGQGRLPDVRVITSPPVLLEDVRMEEIRRELPKLLDRFSEMEPDVREELNQDVPEAGKDLTGFDPAEAEQVAAAVPEIRPEEVRTELPETATDWQPRQEVMEIAEQRFKDDVAVIPRVYRPVLPTSPVAPDVVLPIEAPDLAVLQDVSPATAPIVPNLQTGPGGGGSGRGLAGLPIEPPPPVPDPIELAPLPDLTMHTAETPSDVTEMEPVEELLRLQTQSWVDAASPEYRYFKIQIFRHGIESLPVMPREVVLLLDCSESMTNSKLRQCVKGLDRVLDTLGDKDLFNIMTFRDTVETCFPESRPGDVVRRAQGRAYISELRAYGKTDVYASLQKLRTMRNQANRPFISLLVTDGRPTMGLVDSSDIIEGFTRDNNSRISMFSVGGGKRANKYLLDLLSFRNRGDSLVVPENEEIPDALFTLASQLQRPVLADLKYQFSDVPDVEIYPKTLTHLYLDRPLILVGRVPLNRKRLALQIVGQSAQGKHDMVFDVDLDGSPKGPESLRIEWAWQCIFDRIGTYIATRRDSDLEAIEQIATRYGISVPYAYSLDSELRR